MRFLNVKTDFAFKRVFGGEDSKPRLISFLNAIIEFENEKKITGLTLLNPNNMPVLKGMKDTYVDVKALLDDGTTVIIEMQVLNHEGLENRILYNTAKNYSFQLVKGEEYHLLKPVIAVTILNFNMFENNNEIINRFKVMNKKDFSTYSDDIELIFVELNKFKKPLEECCNDLENWLFFLQNSGDLTVVPQNISEEIAQAYNISSEIGLSHEELELQYNQQQYIAIHKGSISLATKQGIEQGIEQGVSSVAKKLKDSGVSIEIIKQTTGLTGAEIQSL